MAPNLRLSDNDFVWILGSLCQMHRVPFDPALLLQQFPPPYDRTAVLNAAKALDLKAGERKISARELIALPLPCVALLRPGRGAGDSEPRTGAGIAPGPTEQTPTPKPALIVKASDKGFLYFEAGSNTPHQLALDQFESDFEPEVMLIAKVAAEATDEDLPLAKQAFGFKWFVPELLKHKRIWRDVLVASLAIQLVALATPLFTQVVIDKVVVHQTQNTLWVVGIALIMFMLFSAVMTWMRQYLVLHTGNRVDAVLGQTVFRHLLRLPMPYFEHRQTGVLVARLHGVEQIREFVAGAAVTLLLDCPFLVIFLAVMFWYSWQLTLIVLAKLNKQFLVGARNTAFVTEYVSGMATVKSLQMEPVLEGRYGELLAQYLAAGFETKQIG